MSKHHRALLGEGDNLPARMNYAPHEQAGVHEQKTRLARKAKIGADWDGKAANDNISWPLATALIREGNTELLKAAMYYRKIHDTAKSEAKLGGSSARLDEGMALDRRTVIRANGSIAYKEVKQKQSADIDIPAKRYTSPPPYDSVDHSSEEVKVSNWSNVPKPWNGDAPVNNMIDAQRRLGELRFGLGPLVEALEMAVIDGATYQEIGNAAGIADRSGSIAAGRALAHTALVSLRSSLGELKREAFN